MTPGASPEPRVVGRYMLCDEIAAGGMATVHIGRLLGAVGFARTVAIKRLHPQFAKDPDFSAMFLDEARIASRIRHPNVVATLDVLVIDSELLVVMEYVHGEPLSRLIRAAREQTGRGVPLPIAMSIISGALYGLHAAHDARDDRGEPLHIVHRDVSPHNILVGPDGVPRVVDFGVAKAADRIQVTREGALKGKIAYMSPEQIDAPDVDRRTDVYAASVVLWEMLTGQRLFVGGNEVGVLKAVLRNAIDPPSKIAPWLSPEVDALVMKGLSRDREQRFATAWEMAEAAQRVAYATPGQVGEWVKSLGGAALDARAARVLEIESGSSPEVGRRFAGSDDEATLIYAGATPPPSPLPPLPSRPLPPLPTPAVLGAAEAMPAAAAPEAPPSQVSALNVSASLGRRPRMPLAVAVAAPVVILAVVLGFALSRPSPTEDAAANAAPPADSATTATTAPAPPATIAPAAPPPTADPTPQAAPSAAATTPTAVAPGTATASATAAPIARAPSATAAAAPPPAADKPHTATTTPRKGNCNPPYTIDARGVRVPKMECL